MQRGESYCWYIGVETYIAGIYYIPYVVLHHILQKGTICPCII